MKRLTYSLFKLINIQILKKVKDNYKLIYLRFFFLYFRSTCWDCYLPGTPHGYLVDSPNVMFQCCWGNHYLVYTPLFTSVKWTKLLNPIWRRTQQWLNSSHVNWNLDVVLLIVAHVLWVFILFINTMIKLGLGLALNQ